MTDHSLFVASLAETFWAVGTSVAASAAPGVPLLVQAMFLLHG
jgi:hypothetical protein